MGTFAAVLLLSALRWPCCWLMAAAVAVAMRSTLLSRPSRYDLTAILKTLGGRRNCVINRQSVVDGAGAPADTGGAIGLLFENVLMVLKYVLPAALPLPASGRGWYRHHDDHLAAGRAATIPPVASAAHACM